MEGRPARVLALAIAIIVFMSAAGTHASYLQDPRKCGKPECNADKKFAYMPKTIYTYKYTVNVNSTLSGAESAASSILIEADFDLLFLSPCEGLLQIKTATLLDDPEKYNSIDMEDDGFDFDRSEDETSSMFSEALVEFPLGFSFDGGRIGEICPNTDEKPWVLNFKRGILSAFQNTMKRFDRNHRTLETDVIGECDTEYRFDSVNGTTLIIGKEKDIKNCVKRYNLQSVIPTSDYVFQSKYHRWTPIASKVSCKQYVDHNVYTAISCTEDHSFEPFLNQTMQLSKTAVTQDIVLLSEESSSYGFASNLPDILDKRESLLFHHYKPTKTDAKNLFVAENHIKEICEMDSVNFHADVPDEFRKLIYAARQLTFSHLTHLVKESNSLCASGKKHILQALPYVQTSASIKVMKDIIMAKTEISRSTAHEWLLAIALFPRPDPGVMESVAEIMLKNENETEVKLAVSAMIYSHCHAPRSDYDCGEEAFITDMLDLLEGHVKETCYNGGNVHQGIVGLKALGNAAVTTPTLLDTLHACILNPLPLEVRVAAVEAHRRLSCDVDRGFLLDVYLDQTFDSELRIAAYSEVMKCPTYSVVKAVVASLEKEEVNQVGAFVWSHLQNMLKSSMPSRVEIQALLQDEELVSKFSTDMRMFSQNFETSLYINEYGVGGFLGSNIIYSHKSYVPRTLMTNFTMFLFGEPINLFEMTLNIEGVEQYVENMFRSGSIFKQKHFELPLQLLRFMRSAANPATLKDRIATIPNFIRDSFMNTKVSVAFKVFGHELSYMGINNKEDFDRLLEKMDPLRIIKDFLSGQEMKLDRMGMLMDASYVAPLGVGLPLNLDVSGTAAVNLNLAGFVNTTLFTSQGYLDVEGKLKPSVAVSLVGAMGVDAHYKETSVKLKGKVFSSSALEGSLDMKGYKFVSVSFNLPMNKSDIFSAETRLISQRGSNEVSVKGATANLNETKICSWPVLDEILGLKICTNFLFPNAVNVLHAPLLLFKGPLKFGISLEKSDPSAKKYILEYKVHEMTNKTVISAVFETPESLVNRTMRALVNIDAQSYNLTLLIQSQNNKLQAEGVYRRSPLDKSLNFGLDINGKKHVDIQVALLSIKGKYGYTYEPKLLFAINGKRVADLGGSLRWVEKKSISQCDVSLNFNTNRFEAALTGYVRKNNASIATNMKLLYKFENSEPQTLKMEVKLGNRSSKHVKKFYGGIQLESSAYPHINFLLSLKYLVTHEHLEWNVEMQTSPFLKDERQRLHAQLMYASFKTYAGSKVNTYVQVRKPSDDIDFKVGFSHEVLSSSSNTAVMVRYASGKEIKVSLDLRMPRGSMMYFESKLTVNLPSAKEPMVIAIHIHEKLQDEYDIDFAGTWFSGHNITVKGMYQDRSTYVVTNHNVKLLLKSQLFNDVLLMGRLYMSDEEYKIDVQIEHSEVKYQLIARHFYQPGRLIETYGELRYDASSYVLSNYIDVVKRRAQIEVHLDRYRDIHVVLNGDRNHSMVTAGVDVKWDANRDPSQKFVAAVRSFSPGSLNYDGELAIEYPGRTINAAVLLKNDHPEFKGNGKLSWSSEDAISADVYLNFDLQRTGTLLFNTKILTPFLMWESTSFNYGFRFLEYGIHSNASLDWMRNQSVTAEITSNYKLTDDLTDVSLSAVVNSTAPEIKSLQARFSHYQTSQKYDTLFLMQSSSEHLIKLTSGAVLNSTGQLTEICGAIKLNTPFETFKRGHLEYLVKAYTGRKVKGEISFNVNDKSYSTSFKGSFRTLYESRFSFKLVTPYDRYKVLNGRIGYSASRKHLIAELRGHDVATGVEILYVYNNLYNFDMKLHVFTGFTIVTDMIIVGKIDPEHVDFRCGWNKLMVGATGTAHFASWYDVNYSAMLYLPAEQFSKTGAVAKLIFSDRIDLAAQIEAAEKRFGLKVQAMQNPEHSFAQSEAVILQETNFVEDVFSDEVSNTYYLDKDDRTIIWRGIFELDSVVYNTSVGNMEISFRKKFQYKYYDIISFVDLPFVKINLEDNLKIQNLLNMTNELNIKTSHGILQEFKMTYEGNGILGAKLASKFDGSVRRANESHNFIVATNYTYTPISGEPNRTGSHVLNFLMRTPFKALDHCIVDLMYANDKNAYETDLNIDINQSKVNVGGVLVIEENNFFNSSFNLKIVSPHFVLPICKIYLEKDFTEIEKKVNGFLMLPGESEANPIRKYSVEGSWHYGGSDFMKFEGHLKTPSESLRDLKGFFQYSYDAERREQFVDVYAKYLIDTEMRVTGRIYDNTADVTITSSLDGLRTVHINGFVKDMGNGLHKFEAALGQNSDYKLQGWYTVQPTMLEMKITKGENKGELISMSINMKRKDNIFEFASLIQQLDDRVDIAGDVTAISEFVKTFNLRTSTSFKGYELLTLNGHIITMNPQTNMLKLKGETTSEWLQTQFEWTCDTWFDSGKGLIDTSVKSTQLQAFARLEWVWMWMENIWTNLMGSYTYGDVTKDVRSKMSLWNPRGNFRESSFGSDVSFNGKSWCFGTNVTLVAPANNDVAFEVQALLPQNADEVFSVIGKLNYTQNYTYFSHLLKYSTLLTNKTYQTISEFDIADDTVKGVFLIGNKAPDVIVLDRFTSENINNKHVVVNVFESKFLKDKLNTKVIYEKPSKHHKVLFNIYYPPTVPILDAYLKFHSINNMFSKVNCSTPFRNVTHMTLSVKAETNPFFYHRYGQLLWTNNSALLNYTHVKNVVDGGNKNVSDGLVTVEFPLATRHTGKLVYKIEDFHLHSEGFSELEYNNNTLLNAKYTKQQYVTQSADKNVYDIQLDNSYLPLDLIYTHDFRQSAQDVAPQYLDSKKVEVYRANNRTFNFTGELQVHKSAKDMHVKLLATHTVRTLYVDAIYGDKNMFETNGKLTLKPEVWFSYHLVCLNKDTRVADGKKVELELSYPKRDFILIGEYDLTDSALTTNLAIRSNRTKRVKEMEATLDWRTDGLPGHHFTTITIYHPSFKKNVTLNCDFIHNDTFWFNVNSTLDYSVDQRKRLTLISVLRNKSTIKSKLYAFNTDLIHRASRLHLEMNGTLLKDYNILEIIKTINYKRSYLPLQYWNAHMSVDRLNKKVEMQRESLRDLASFKAKYASGNGVYRVDSTVLKGKELKISGNLIADLPRRETEMVVNFTPDASEQLRMEGWYRDKRHAFFSIWRVYDRISVSDIAFDTRLNHSRMLSSSLAWRTEIKNEMSTSAQSSWNYLWNYVSETVQFWTDYMKNEAIETVSDVWLDAKPIVQDFVEDVREIKNVQDDIDYFKTNFNKSFSDNEFYMQDAYKFYLVLAEEMSFNDKMGTLPKIFTELWEIMGETGKTIRQSIVWLIDNVKNSYEKFAALFRSLTRGDALTQVSHFMSKIAGKYDKVIRDVHVSFIGYIEFLWTETATFLHQYWTRALQYMEPTVIQVLHYIETMIWEQSRKIMELFNRSQTEILQSDYFAKNTNLTQDLEKFYKNITSNGLMTNIRNYSQYLWGVVNDKVFTCVPFGRELKKIADEIYEEVLELKKLPLVNLTVQTTNQVMERVMFLYNTFDVGTRIQSVLPVLYRHATDITRTAINNEMMNHRSKTLFIFSPENGILRLEQKLPIPWHAFNETPNFQEIPEYKSVLTAQQYFSPGNNSFWPMYYQYMPFLDPVNWMPPFKAQAIIIGNENFVTFNKKSYHYASPCSFLLAKDFVDNDFTLVLNYNPTKGYHEIVMLIGDELVTVDLRRDTIVANSGATNQLPVDVGNAHILHQSEMASVISKLGFSFECNLKHDICTLNLAGWYFGKTAGLLGTMDSEPNNDFMTSDGLVETDLEKFAQSWAIDVDECVSRSLITYEHIPEYPYDENVCDSFFASRESQFNGCFSVIDPAPFNRMCRDHMMDIEDSICTSAVAYNQVCNLENIPVRTPYVCVKCPLNNGTYMLEGDYVQLKEGDYPRSTDVVFVIEAGDCNTNLTERRGFHTLVSLLEEALQESGVKNNRYAVVTFGGTAVYSTPRTIMLDNNEFTTSKLIPEYFEHVPAEAGDGDIFGAVSFATKLRFRPGVSKTFILVPCTECDPANMTLDYSVLHEVLMEKSAVLHILMNSEFHLDKAKLNKVFYGIDADTAYTKNDFKNVKGDADLRRQVKLTKSTLGYCLPLALETNGTLFTAKKLEAENAHNVKKFVSVFARRVARTAEPPACQTCECIADNNGIDFTDCYPCDFPAPNYSDFGFRNNFTETFLQTISSDVGNEMDFDMTM